MIYAFDSYIWLVGDFSVGAGLRRCEEALLFKIIHCKYRRLIVLLTYMFFSWSCVSLLRYFKEYVFSWLGNTISFATLKPVGHRYISGIGGHTPTVTSVGAFSCS